MHGVIAAGSVPTAEAGAEVLRMGGNAADAAAAACFATAVGEPTLTSLAGGGIMTYRDAQTGEVTICDFFSNAPLLRPDEVKNLEFHPKDLDFGPTTQRFFIGAGSAGVPGVLPGLCSVIEKWGSMPLAKVVAPACRMLRSGVVMGAYQGRAAKLLEPILTHTASGRAVFHTEHNKMIAQGDTFRLPQLATTLEALALDWRDYYRTVLCEAMLKQFGPSSGGLLEAADFDRYEVTYRKPLSLRYRNSQVLTPSAPAAGGTMIALMLKLLDGLRVGQMQSFGGEHIRHLAHAMSVADMARGDKESALSGDRFTHWLKRYHALNESDTLSQSKAAAGGSNDTTHVSVLDSKGNAAAITFSYGEGNAHFIGNSGIMMNNLMGEEDLFPSGFGTAPVGERLPTMMSPTLVCADNGDVTVMGTGGANRIRTAIVQVISQLLDRQLSPTEAVRSPRLHFEDGVLNLETFDLTDGAAMLEALQPEKMVLFEDPNLFFGGVHIVQRLTDGTLRGAGDPRRGGVCITA